MKVLNICKCDDFSNPFILRNICDGRQSAMIITKNDHEEQVIPYQLNKAFTQYEFFKKNIDANSYAVVDLKPNALFYFLKPIYTTQKIEERELYFIKSNDNDKILWNLYNTPKEILNITTQLETKSYNPSIILENLGQNEVYITVTDLTSLKSVPFILENNTVHLQNLIGNNNYFIRVVYNTVIDDVITHQITKDYNLYVVKKQLADYDHVLVDVKSITSVDVDNNIFFEIENLIGDVNVDNAFIEIDDIHFNNQITLVEQSDLTNIHAKIDFIGNLDFNKDYEIQLLNVEINGIVRPPYKIKFATRPFHKCVHQTQISEIYLQSLNTPENNKNIFIINNNNIAIEIFGLIGYADTNIEVASKLC